MTLSRTAMTRPGAAGGRLPFLPGLDGIRALAVVAVLLYHAEVGWMPGGFLGVEVFFVLSGYLITSILWGEERENGRIELVAFYGRRARRLLPAVIALLIVVTTAFVIGWSADVGRIRGDIAAALAYVSNWYQIATEQSYFTALGRPSPFRHLWSLAIEEQFYLVWPAILLFGLRGRTRRFMPLITAGLVVCSIGVMLATFSIDTPTRAYFGTDTRASGLLLGALLAFVWRPFTAESRARHIPGWTLDFGVWASLGIIGWMVVRADEVTGTTFVPGILVVSLATTLLIAVTVHPKTQSSLFLSWRWIQWIGRRSYSIYLWHWPVFVVTRPGADLDIGVAPALALRLILTLALAELSYRFVEEPIRNGALRELRAVIAFRIRYHPNLRPVLMRRYAALGLLAAAGLSVLAAAVIAAPSPMPTEVELALRDAQREGVDVPPVRPDLLDVTPSPSPSPSKTSPAPVRKATTKPKASVVSPVVALPPMRAKGIAIGDSVMLGAKRALKAQFVGLYVNAAVSRQTPDGLALLKKWKREERLPNMVIVQFGNNGAFTRAQFDELMRTLRSVQTIVVVTVKVPRRWEANVNKTIYEGKRRHPRVRVADWKRRWRGCKGGKVFSDDGFHLTKVGARCYADVIAAAMPSSA